MIERPGWQHLETTRDAALEVLRDWVKEQPDGQVPQVFESGRPVTRRELLDAIESRTEFGREMVEQWLGRVLEHISTAKSSSGAR